MNKTEYIKQLKRLIKKYHPDFCNDSYMESMYNEITKKLVNELNKLRTNNKTENQDIKNQDYAYYKSGIKYYRNIHPDKFYKRNQDTTLETKKYDELARELNKIYLSFNLSEYYFKKVVNEFSQSPYLEDAREKIKLLKKLYKSYENIVLEENKIINNEKFINEMGLKIL